MPDKIWARLTHHFHRLKMKLKYRLLETLYNPSILPKHLTIVYLQISHQILMQTHARAANELPFVETTSPYLHFVNFVLL